MSLPTRPSSPVSQDFFPHITQDNEPTPPPSHTPSFSQLAGLDMGHPKERSHLDIILDAQHVILKGTGVDVEPGRLSGRVILYLAEDTSLKEITLQFRGKARIPVPVPESRLASSGPSMTHVVCNHEWSFLEGDKRHARTLKAGRHTFPFHLQIGGNLPSTIGTSVFGGASVCYKLRAIAVRTGLNHNLQAIVPIYIDRSFTHEALEYQQTLEIENTWPEKVMYSIVLPHKAWAAGDRLTAILKFSPITKGVHVSHIKTSIQETTKMSARNGTQESTHVVASIYHAIVDRKPIVVNSRHSFSLASLSGSGMQSHNTAGPSSGTPGNLSPTGIYSPIHTPSPTSLSPSSNPETPDESEDSDLTVVITIPIPIASITPTHFVEPIIVRHRVRWSILIGNKDGHTSELRCSLPIHILDNRLLEEARSFSAATRRIVLGFSESSSEESEDRELPSYAAHIRDRVANMFLPEAATVRVNNPWINRIGSSQSGVDLQEFFSSFPSSRARSGFSTPSELHSLSHLPHSPGPDGIPTLDLLHSELLLSLSDTSLRQDFFTPEPHTPSDPLSSDLSQPPSQNRSRQQSRNSSRPASPDGSHSHNHDGAIVHHGSSHGRNLHSIFRATMKPFTSLSHHHSLFSRHGSHHSHDEHHLRPHVSHTESAPHPSQQSGTVTSPDPVTNAALLHQIFTEVPDYSIASRGFIGGGVPPLESMRGLPSYEEASRKMVERAASSDTGPASSSVHVASGPSAVAGSCIDPIEGGPPHLERHCSLLATPDSHGS